MLSPRLAASFLFVALLLVNTVNAIPVERRDVQWSFELHSDANCNSTGDVHFGAGSTGCRANLNSVASAYKLNLMAEGCQIEFFDNTMCDSTEISELARPGTTTKTCRVPGSERHFGSYMVTCGNEELK